MPNTQLLGFAAGAWVFVLREALSEMHTFGFFISVWVFAQTCFLKEALSEIHIVGFFPH